VDVAAFQLAVGLGGLPHGHGFARAQAEPAIGQQGDRLIQGAGSTVGGGLGERDAEVSGVRVGQGDDPLSDRELGRDDADGSAAAEQQQRLAAFDVQLPQDADGRLGRP
jgi:hypothetical protein